VVGMSYVGLAIDYVFDAELASYFTIQVCLLEMRS
jgi:hypothetical protein